MAKVTPPNKRPTTNANGVKAPVQPRITAKGATASTQARLIRVTTKHSEAFSLLAKR